MREASLPDAATPETRTAGSDARRFPFAWMRRLRG